MGYFYNPEIILGEKFATNLHTKFCWKWKLTNQVKHYNKRYNACFLYLIHVESKKIIKQVCVLKQTNKLCACVRKTLCLCAEKAWNSFLFQSRKPSMINKFTEERYFVQLSLLSCFCTPSICPFLLKVGVFSQGFRWIKAFYKTSENRKPREKSDCWRSMFLSRFEVGQKMQPWLSGGGKCRSSVMYCYVVPVTVKNGRWSSFFTILSKLFYKTYGFY